MYKTQVKKLIAKLPFDLRYALFFHLAKTLGISHYLVEREYGSFIGPLYDQSVIKPFMRDGSFSRNIVDLIIGHASSLGSTVFIDVGANIGMVTTKIAKETGAKCIAVEPDDDNFRILKANLVLNAIEDVRLFNAAMGASEGRVSFTRNAFNSGDHRISPDGEHSVPVMTLDGLGLANSAEGIIIKIDTQGAEPLIFQGGRTTLEQASLIIAEFWPWGMQRMGVEPSPILDFIRETQRGGHLLRHGEPIASAPHLSPAELTEQLAAVIADGGEYAQVDLVLVK